MLFNSGEFLIFFPVVVLGYFIMPKKLKNVWLLISSYYFYMSWNAKYAILLFSSSIITYVGGILIEKAKTSVKSVSKQQILKNVVLSAAISINLAILFYYKYINFTLDLVTKLLLKLGISVVVPEFDIILPVGISFYIFQALGYLIDVYRDEIYAEKNIINYGLFVSFFPQLVAGPIERSKNLLKQLAVAHKFDEKLARDGLLTMLWGYFIKLVIADRCAVIVDTIYNEANLYFGDQIVLASVLFALQIYCDFMGYSTIAKGAAKVIGIDLMDNFRMPYFATSIKEFWRRWHISLSSWFRDYVYIPLGGSRCSRIKKYRNLVITFMISGLWHGANLTFVAWGLLHGIYQVLEDVLKPFVDKIVFGDKLNPSSYVVKFFRIVKTFILVDIAWIFFRARTITEAIIIIRNSLIVNGTGAHAEDGIFDYGLDERNLVILAIAVIVLIIVGIIKEKCGNALEWLSGKPVAIRFLAYWSAVVLIILSLDIMGQEFIYFQF